MRNLPSLPGPLRDAARDLFVCLGFFSRLPLPLDPLAPGAGASGLPGRGWLVPIAGAILGAIAALALGLAAEIGLPPMVSATLAVGALALATGALHEDGLADLADGFGGGATRARKLEIMRDSRIGAYGAIALTLMLVLRVAALAALIERGVGVAGAALVLAAAASRAFSLVPLALLPAARADGLGAAAGRLSGGDLAAASAVAAAIALVLGGAILGAGQALLAIGLALGATLAIAAIARRQIGGQTGDVAGAAQQMAEVACLCGLLIGRGGA
jgi:adenosylcobinamide-GDP ribazoletransferase